MDKRYEQLKRRLCRTCPLRPTCPQFPEQLDACADADLIQKEDLLETRLREDFRPRYDLEGDD
jgi:hypothetical protein